MVLTRRRQQSIGIATIFLAVCVQLYSDFACYKLTIGETILAFAIASIALIPSILFLLSNKPFRSSGAAITAAFFYAWAYYVDCVQPYAGGGASMIFVAVILYGPPFAVVVGFLSGMAVERPDA